ncbi:hypothetical protein BKA82DRAFT_4355242 [Pisolithus tinctorius]|nr:hypothetical protein BKA82DRAFT_4355242 [Pisolithus tinctorius]
MPSLCFAFTSVDFIPATTLLVGVLLPCVRLASEPLSRPCIASESVGAQQDWLEHKHSHMDFNYWKVKERKSAHMEDHEHQLQMQCELHVHEQVMAAQEVKKMKLVVQLEQLCIQNLMLQKGIAGGEDQGTLSDSQNVHLTL